MKNILLTAAYEDAEEFTGWLKRHEFELLHLPLEKYQPIEWNRTMEEVLNRMDEFENIVFGNKRNAIHFLERVTEKGYLDAVKNRLNLAVDESTALYLEEKGIPAVRPPGDPKPIDLVEFMLRLRRMGATLYPCGSHTREDIPAFLEELDITVTELELFDMEGPSEEELEQYRKNLAESQVHCVIIHSRRAVTRISAAFPEINLANTEIISADTGITRKLEQQGIKADFEAAGSWRSLYEKLLELELE